MPRVSREQTDRNRQAIEETSSHLLREHGISGVSVAELMAAAGLTHGAFYGHFESKDQLAATACNRAFEASIEKWESRVEGKRSGKSALKAIVDGYLSTEGVTNPGHACPAAMLASDVAREDADKPVRGAYISGVNELLGILEKLQETGTTKADRAAALMQLSTMVGALLLARATLDAPISDEILNTVRHQLLGQK